MKLEARIVQTAPLFADGESLLVATRWDDDGIEKLIAMHMSLAGIKGNTELVDLLTDGFQLVVDEYLVLMPKPEPCVHGRYDGHWPKGVCHCYENKLSKTGKGYWQSNTNVGEYVPDEWILCYHEPWCPGAFGDTNEN